MAFPIYTNTFTNGSTADATQVNQNFSDILNGISDTTKDISVNAITAAGSTTLNGNITLGNSSTKTVNFTGSLNSSIPVSTTNSFDVGSSSFGLKSIYIASASFTTRIVAGATVNWTFTMPTTAGALNQTLTTDGAGVTSWSYGPAITSVITTYAILLSDNVIMVSGSAFTATLPTAVGCSGKRYFIQKSDATLTNIVTIATTSAQTIRGLSTIKLNTQFETWELVSDGSNWQVLAHQTTTLPVSYAPSYSASFGTIAVNSTVSWREGRFLKILGFATVGTVTAAAASVEIGFNGTTGNVNMDLTVLSSNNREVGTYSTTNNGGMGRVLAASDNTKLFFGQDAIIAGSSLQLANANGIVGNAGNVTFTVSIPISGWLE